MTLDFDQVLTKGWPQVGVDFIKGVISDPWRGSQGDDLGRPWFGQRQ
jgi:hypothetical protein